MWTKLAGAAGAIGLTLLLAACGNNTAQDVGKISVDWTGNDVVIEAVQDPDVAGVVCHVSYFDRGLIDRLQQGNWFEDPSYSAVDCSQTGPIVLNDIDEGPSGEAVFSESRSLVFKSLRVTRIWDKTNNMLVYLAHANELTQGSGKMSISTVALPPGAAPTGN